MMIEALLATIERLGFFDVPDVVHQLEAERVPIPPERRLGFRVKALRMWSKDLGRIHGQRAVDINRHWGIRAIRDQAFRIETISCALPTAKAGIRTLPPRP